MPQQPYEEYKNANYNWSWLPLDFSFSSLVLALSGKIFREIQTKFLKKIIFSYIFNSKLNSCWNIFFFKQFHYNIDLIFWPISKGIWGTATYCKSFKPHKCPFPALVDNPPSHNTSTLFTIFDFFLNLNLHLICCQIW